MQLFIDSADPKQIKTAWQWGIIDGVTTNPSLAAKVGKPYKQIVTEILEIISPDTTVSLEVVATEYKGILEQARELSKIDNRVVVKIPATQDGIKATKVLSAEGILVNVTLVFSANQALLAAKAGAFYVSPFVGRLDDIEEGVGDEVIEEIVQIYENYNFETGILYASVRDLAHVKDAALAGVDIATIPFEILEQMFEHKLTQIGLEKFLSDWKASGLKLPL